MSYLKYINNQLQFDEASLLPLLQPYRGPVYVYSRRIVRRRIEQMSEALSGVKLFYAVKANANLEILKVVKNSRCNVDVVSLGEVKRALEAGFRPDQIIFSGVGKTKSEIAESLKYGIHQLNAESEPEVDRISQLAKELGVTADLVLRLNPNIDIKTHPYIATGLKENKFGIEISKVDVLIQKCLQPGSHLRLKGISLHLGSQMLEIDSFASALQLIKPLFSKWKSQVASMDRFDIGGGLGIIYHHREQPDFLKTEADLLASYSQVIKTHLADFQKQGIQLQSEPGRWLVGHSGVLMTEIQYIKQTEHKKFMIVDSGMNHLMRPSLYQAYHEIYALKDSSSAEENFDVVGPVCESSDYFAKNRLLKAAAAGDFLAVADVGAYGFSMSNNYNLHSLPQEIFIG